MTNHERKLATVNFRGQLYQVDAQWLARRRIMRKTIVYSLLILLVVVMIGPLVYSLFSSFSDDPLSWPPSFTSPRLWPPNWVAAWDLGVQGNQSAWTGGWAPGGQVELAVTFRYSEPPTDSSLPQVQLLAPPYESNPAADTHVEVIEGQKKDIDNVQEITYKVILTHQGIETYPLLPIAVVGSPGSEFVRATLPPDLVRSRFSGTYLTWKNVTPGAIGYLFNHYIRAWTTYKGRGGMNLFPRWIRNSFFIAGIRIIVTALFATMAGFAFSRLHFPGKNALFLFMIFTMMVPGQVTFISNYLVVRDGVFGLSKLLGMDTFLNTFWALFLPSLVSTSAVFMMKQFMESIPIQIEEAARIDGASTFRIYTRIILPLCKPALAAVAGILTFQGSWNEFFWPMVVLTQGEKQTLPVGMNYFLHYYTSVTGSVWNMILAGTVVSMIPILIIYLLFQRYFIEGFHLSGIKQ